MKNFFSKTATSIEKIKAEYRALMKTYHPDCGGDKATAQAIIAEMNSLMNKVISGAVKNWKQSNPEKSDINVNEEMFGEVLSKVMDLNCDIEIIGFWIYAFNSFEVKEQLKELGFWFSKKHKAWVYSGTKKRFTRSRSTTEDIREKHGSKVVREREEWLALS